MRIAPIDIAHKTFSRKMMGLDADEVADFLRDIADQMEEIIRERNSLKEALREKDLSIMEYRERDQTLKSTIETASKMSEQIRRDAEHEARLIVQDAQQKGELIVADARDSLKRIYQEISELKRSRMQFDASLRSLLHAHLAMLEQSHSLVPEPQITVGRPAPQAASPAPLNQAQPATQAATHSANPLTPQNPNVAAPPPAASASSHGVAAGTTGAAGTFDPGRMARMPRPTQPFPK